MSVELRERR